MTEPQEEPLPYNPELIEELRQQRVQASDNVEQAKKYLQKINEQLFAELSKAPGEKVVLGEWTPTIVRAKTWVYDEDGLKKAIGKIKWNQVTDQVLNKDKLAKLIPTDIISKYAEEVPYGTPHVRVNKTKKEDD